MLSVKLKSRSFPGVRVYMNFFLGFDMKNSLFKFVQAFYITLYNTK